MPKKTDLTLIRGGKAEAQGLAHLQRELDVLVHVGLGTPERDVRLVVHLPQDPPPAEMLGGRRGPPGVPRILDRHARQVRACGESERPRPKARFKMYIAR